MRDDLHEPFILELEPRVAAATADGEHGHGDRGQVAAGEADLSQHVFEHVVSGVPRRRRSQRQERLAWPHIQLPGRRDTLLCWQGADGGEAGPERGLGGVPVVVPDHGCFQQGQALDGLAEGQRGPERDGRARGKAEQVIPRQAAGLGGRVDRVDFRGEAVRRAWNDVPYRQAQLGDHSICGHLVSDGGGRCVA